MGEIYVFLKKIANALSSKKYRVNPQSGVLTREEYAALSVGAINAEQTSCFCDSLETGRDKKDTKNDLMNYYDISDYSSAIETLSWLRDRGRRIYFDAISGFCAGTAEKIDDAVLADDEKPNTYGYIKNLKSAIPDLISNGFIQRKEDIAYRSVLAWDMGRLVLISRYCADVSYISDEEAWQFIMQAYAMSKGVYHSWEELAAGYVTGRAMFGGEGIMLNGIMRIAKGLLCDKESPFKKYTL